MSSITQTYYSLRDRFFVLGVWLPLLALLGLGFWMQLMIIWVPISVVILAWSIVWFGTRYELTGSTLRIKIGPCTIETLFLHRFEAIEKISSRMISTALSKERLLIHCSNGIKRHISPKRSDVFINAVIKRNPKIRNLSVT